MGSLTDELLGANSSAPAAVPKQSLTDELLGGSSNPMARDIRSSQAVEQQRQHTAFDDLPIANRESNQGTADFPTLAKAAVVDDDQTKLKILAGGIFPNDPEAYKRFGMSGGHPVYVGQDDKLYQAAPSGKWAAIKKFGAEMAGHAPGVAMGALGGLAGGGPVGGIVGAGLGAAGGEGIRKIAGNLGFDEPQTPGGNALAMGKEGALGAAGQAAGTLVGKWIERNVARDIGRFDKPAAQALQGKAQALGVDLTPAQITNLPSLKAQQGVVTNIPRTADTMDAFAGKQVGQIQAAVGKHLDSLSPIDSADVAGGMVRDASKKALTTAQKARAAEAGPLYDEAFDNFKGLPQTPGIQGKVNDLMKRPVVKDATKLAMKRMQDDGLAPENPANSLRGMHYMKVQMDSDLAQLQAGRESSIKNIDYSTLKNVRNNLVSLMDEVSPQNAKGSVYKQARNTFSEFSEDVDAAKEGLTSVLSKLPDDKLRTAAERMFGGDSGPLTVAQARKQIETTNPEAWQAIKRTFLQQKFEDAGKVFASRPSQAMQGPKYWASMQGVKVKESMQEAMTKQEYQSFNDLMDVLGATARTVNQNSDTAWKEAAKEDFKQEAGGMFSNAIANTIDFPSTLKRTGQWVRDFMYGKHADEVARIITSPDGMAKLKQLRQMSPKSKNFMNGTAALLGLSVPAPGGADVGIPKETQ